MGSVGQCFEEYRRWLRAGDPVRAVDHEERHPGHSDPPGGGDVFLDRPLVAPLAQCGSGEVRVETDVPGQLNQGVLLENRAPFSEIRAIESLDDRILTS